MENYARKARDTILARRTPFRGAAVYRERTPAQVTK
jgi:hypothetical protein